MDHLIWDDDPAEPLRSPILVAAFEGWFDVGGAATGAVEALRGDDAVRVAHVDADEFFDFSERRPVQRIDEDGVRRVRWPHNHVHARQVPDRSRDLLLMEGVEPHLRWRSFVDAVVGLVGRFDVAMVVTLGAMVAEIPHTRPPTVTGSTTEADLATVLRLDRPSYQGPTGVVGALHERLDELEIPAVSLRASVPHYVSGTPNPKASRALLERFERVTGLPTDWADLDEAAAVWEAQVDEAMAEDLDVTDYVHRLEDRFDEHAASSLPSSDDLAAEFERFLRQQGDE